MLPVALADGRDPVPSPPARGLTRPETPGWRSAFRFAAVAAVLVLVASACGSEGPASEPPGPDEEVSEDTDEEVGVGADGQAASGVEEVSGDPVGEASPEPAAPETDVEEPGADAPDAGEGAAGEGAAGEAQPEGVADAEDQETRAGEGADEEAGQETAEAVAVPLPPVASVRLVSQNILHGVGCPPDSDSCLVGERVSLFMEQLAEAGCPELVSLQEANERIVGLVSGEVGSCGYEIVWDDDPGLDREVVLTTLEVIDFQRRTLADRFRSAYLVRVASPIGVIDFLTTHLAAGADDRDCDPGLCPPPCDPAGSLRTCQARQVLDFAREVTLAGAVTVVGGDLNDAPGSPTLAVFDEAGYVDSHLAAGHGECDPATGSGCTAGREDSSLADMADPSSRQRSRIDYLLYSAPGRDCSVGEGTGLFNAEPAAGDLAFPSDHTAVALTLVCDAVGGDEVDASIAALPEAPADPAPVEGHPIDEVTAQAITAAFETYMDGSINDMELRIDQAEDFPGMREAARLMFEATAEIGAAVRARVGSISRTSAATARIVYSILLDDQVIFDGREGEAVLIGGRWFVARTTFCDLAALSPVAEDITIC